MTGAGAVAVVGSAVPLLTHQLGGLEAPPCVHFQLCDENNIALELAAGPAVTGQYQCQTPKSSRAAAGVLTVHTGPSGMRSEIVRACFSYVPNRMLILKGELINNVVFSTVSFNDHSLRVMRRSLYAL